jgi:DNA mismatch repair protein MutS2
MEKHTLHVLEFDKALDLVAGFASSEAGRDQVLRLSPQDSRAEALTRLTRVTEMRRLLEWGKTPPLSEMVDVRSVLSRSVIPGAVLDAGSILNVGTAARVARVTRSFFHQLRDECGLLWELASGLTEHPELEKAIERAIDEDTNIKDNASPALKRIRQEKSRVSARISKALNNLLRKEGVGSHLRESIVTIRNGRYVVPVKADSRGKVSGIVHDTSQSGATVFIEPMETVELNNSLRTLELEEKDEILRILRELTDAVREAAREIEENVARLLDVDTACAGARFSLEYGCCEPGVNDTGRTVIAGGRHPLLVRQAKADPSFSVVPLDVTLNDGKRGLLITGPNAGGKTVALKTVGVLILLARTGFHVPCEDGTDLDLFDKIYADIGDEQSIELSLSTFSSRMQNLISILSGADGRTLVLLDEAGAGTDPLEGAAIARAVIEDLLEKRAVVFATTHHTSLKVFAHENDLIENASMEFDSAEFRPTYRLIQGIPGASHAFEIASKLGIEERLIDRAKEYCGGESVKFEDLTRELLEKMKGLEERRTSVEASKKELDRMRAEHESRLAEIKKHDRELKKEAVREAKSIVEEARRKAQHYVKELKSRKADAEEVRRIEAEMREEATRLAEAVEEFEEPRAPMAEIRVGERAFVKPLSSDGVIMSLPDSRGRVEVLVGSLRAEIDVKDLFEAKTREVRRVAQPVVYEPKEVPSELSVRGMTAEEAWEEVDKYLDGALLCGYPSVRIIHGKGRGILSKRIRQMLSAHPRVKSFRFGDYYEGSTGVTIVELKLD